MERRKTEGKVNRCGRMIEPKPTDSWKAFSHFKRQRA